MFNVIFCPNYIKELLSNEAEDAELIVSRKKQYFQFEQFSTTSIKTFFGIASLVLMPIITHIITEHQDPLVKPLYLLPIAFHFAPVFLKNFGKKALIEWTAILISANLGFISKSNLSSVIMINIVLLVYIIAMRNSGEYFISFQVWIFFTLVNNIIVLEIESPEIYIEFWDSHKIGLVLYLVMTLALTVALFSPPQHLVKMAGLYKVV
jgi:hypothetical protein